MGYTHYLKQPKKFTDKQWDTFVKSAKQIFKTTDIPLGNAAGDEKTKPVINVDRISFNGVGDDSHETCTVYREDTDFEFCKTAQKPYDEVVVAIYKAAREANPSIVLNSDGGTEVFG